MSIENPVIYVPIRHLATGNWRLSTVLGPLHLSRTLYKSAHFMQNKPNLLDAQMNVSSIITTAYEYKYNWTLGENKPNSNPISERPKMNANVFFTKDYRKKDDFVVRKNKANSNPISVKPKMSANVFVTKDYENETALRPQKTNPIKPNSCGFLLEFIPHTMRGRNDNAGG